jgi:hypothetical protein
VIVSSCRAVFFSSCYSLLNNFLAIIVQLDNYEDDELRFGDEIEVGIVKVDKVAKTVKICVKSAEIRNVKSAQCVLISDASNSNFVSILNSVEAPYLLHLFGPLFVAVAVAHDLLTFQ